MYLQSLLYCFIILFSSRLNSSFDGQFAGAISSLRVFWILVWRHFERDRVCFLLYFVFECFPFYFSLLLN